MEIKNNDSEEIRFLMKCAVEQAKISYRNGGLPYGASLGHKNGVPVALGLNKMFQDKDPVAHSISSCIREAGRRTDWHRLWMFTTASPSKMDIAIMSFLGIERLWVLDDRFGDRVWDVAESCGIEYNVCKDVFYDEMKNICSDKLDSWKKGKGYQQFAYNSDAVPMGVVLDPDSHPFSEKNQLDATKKLSVLKLITGTAFEQARQSYGEDGVPHGACLSTADGSIIAMASNSRVQDFNPIGHAATECIRAAKCRNSWKDLVLTITGQPSPVDVGVICFYGIGAVVICDSGMYENTNVIFNNAELKRRGVLVIEDQGDFVKRLHELQKNYKTGLGSHGKNSKITWREDSGVYDFGIELEE